MDNLQIIARILGLQIKKRSSGYLVNGGGYTSGIEFENLHRVSIHLAKEMDETLKAYRSLKLSDFDKSKLSSWENFEIRHLQCRASS